MRTTIINHKKYTVERVFNMVANYEFTDKVGAVHLVDAEDVAVWTDEMAVTTGDNLRDAIQYAKYTADESEDGIFWWKVK